MDYTNDGYSHLVVGLGNPNRLARFTRHNVGKLMVDDCVGDLKLDYKQINQGTERFNLATYEDSSVIGNKKVGFLKSFRWINKIGKSVNAAREYVDLP